MKRLILPLYFYLLSSILFAFSADMLGENELIVLVVYILLIGLPSGLLFDGYRRAPVVFEQPDE